MNQLENCKARYRSNTWMGRTRTDSPDEFEPSKFDCMLLKEPEARQVDIKRLQVSEKQVHVNVMS